MNFLSIVYLEVIGGHVVIHGYIIYHKYCKQLIKGHVRYIITICPPITKLHMS